MEEAVVVSQLSLVSGVVIIMAGYPGDMNKMLDTNPGLKSRFTHFIEFEDWSPEDCLHLFRKRAT